MKICLALVAAVIALGLILPEAKGAHPTRLCLDAEPDHTYRTSNDGEEDYLVVRLGASDAGHPPEQEGCVTEGHAAGESTEIDLEVHQDEDGFSPETPDAGCVIPPKGPSCRIEPPTAGGQVDMTVWQDFDRDDSTVEADVGEGQEEESDPGDEAEPDSTDVVTWEWMHGDPCSAFQSCHDRGLITIRYVRRTGTFRGDLDHSERRCERDRQIKLRRARRELRDRTVGTTTTSDTGTWRIPLRRKQGRFYAVAPRASGGCNRDRSPTIRI